MFQESCSHRGNTSVLVKLLKEEVLEEIGPMGRYEKCSAEGAVLAVAATIATAAAAMAAAKEEELFEEEEEEEEEEVVVVEAEGDEGEFIDDG